MISQELNDRLSRIGPGTPMGALLRRYWQPVAVTSELEQEPVQPVRVLGEDLTLFRDLQGAIGLIGERCAHRAISLAYGIPQENGLRCAYHGWTYNPEGRVVDMPFEPACLPLKVKSYPVQELGGLVWAYLGPLPAPLLPRWELLVRDDVDRAIEVTPLPCSWLSCMDNSLDPVHYEHLHGAYGNYVARKLGREEPMDTARHLKIEFDMFEYGIYKRRLVEGAAEDSDDWTRGHPILFPNTLLVGDARVVKFQIRVPIDDEHTMHYTYQMSPRKDGVQRWNGIPVTHTTIFEDDGRIVADTTFKQDALAWVGQGPIADRTREHLATSDKGIILYHNLLLEQAERVERGEEPMGVIRESARNEPMIRVTWEDHAKDIYWREGRPDFWMNMAPQARETR
jgi:5,5'-dehydrodivanillate O-demethylase